MTASLLPREHGAYGQITFPLLTALLGVGVSTSGLLIAAATVAGFLGHEPAAVLLGLRGVRSKRDLQQRAIRWLGCAVTLGLAAGIGVLLTMPPYIRWSLLVPVVPALLVAILTARGFEKSWLGETAAAVAFAGVAVPISLAAGAAAGTAAAVALPFALLFVASTLAVRVVILRVRGGGNVRAAMNTRIAVLLLAAGAVAALTLLVARSLLPGFVLVAAAPGLLAATRIAIDPPQPTRLRRLGWTLVGVSVVTALIVVAAG